ncbi:MAG: sensor histidine kinase, partial [Bryobacterales bacterium]|nr:sensor histidine kinase [Bryobacterales bacterium]
RLFRRTGPTDEAAILGRLDQLDATLKTLIEEDGEDDTPDGWDEIVAATEDFSALARSLTRNPQRDPQSIETLFQHHQRVQRISDGILLANSRSAIADGQSLEAQANRMVTESLSLLGACLGLAILCEGLTLRFAATTLRQLDRQANELNRVSWQMLQGQEEAARRFSHELHDELGQSLAAVKANLMALTPGGFEERRADCIHLVDDSISNVRELSQLLRPVILDDFGLDAAVRWLCERFQQRTGVQVSYESEVLVRLPELAETHLFRITQEALTNIARHAGATAVEVSLFSRNGRVQLRVADNGRGISGNGNAREGEAQERNGNGLGLVGMRARAVQAGGALSVRTPAAGGVEVIADLPLELTADGLST